MQERCHRSCGSEALGMVTVTRQLTSRLFSNSRKRRRVFSSRRMQAFPNPSFFDLTMAYPGGKHDAGAETVGALTDLVPAMNFTSRNTDGADDLAIHHDGNAASDHHRAFQAQKEGLAGSQSILVVRRVRNTQSTLRRVKEMGADLARRHGVSRRAFFRTAAGMAAAFVAMNDTYGPPRTGRSSTSSSTTRPTASPAAERYSRPGNNWRRPGASSGSTTSRRSRRSTASTTSMGTSARSSRRPRSPIRAWPR